MKKTVVSALAVSSLFISSCAGDTKCESDSSDTAVHRTVSEGQEWKEITPTELKNSVQMFDKDWMALAVGKKDDMNVV